MKGSADECDISKCSTIKCSTNCDTKYSDTVSRLTLALTHQVSQNRFAAQASCNCAIALQRRSYPSQTPCSSHPETRCATFVHSSILAKTLLLQLHHHSVLSSALPL